MEQLLQQIGAPLIAVVVPIAVFLVKKAIPAMPKVMLPVLAGAFGPAVEGLVAWLGGQEFTGTLGVAMGLAGIGLRELKDQVGKALLATGDDTLRAAWPATAIVLALGLAVALGGCGIKPETPRERLVVAETQYQAMLDTVDALIDRGAITTENRDSVRGAITAARGALDAWHRTPDSFESMNAAIAALQAAQAVLDALEGRSAEAPTGPPPLAWRAVA